MGGPAGVSRKPVNCAQRLGGLAAKIALAAGAAVFSFFLAEAFLRSQEPYWHFLRGKYTNSEFLMIPNPVWNHWPRPESTMTYWTVDPVRFPRPVLYTTNRQGCRYDRELTVPKPRDVVRILVLGDSFTEGYYQENTVAAVLEHRLNASGAGMRFEVVNCGCTSYSPLLEYLRLKNQLVRLQPDEIILNVDLTDVFDDYWNYRPLTKFATNGEPLAVPGDSRWLHRSLVWARYKSYTLRLLSGVRAWSLTAIETRWPDKRRSAYTFDNVFSYYSTLLVGSKEWQEEVGFLLDNISRILLFCKLQGIEITVTTYPYQRQLEPDQNETIWNREVQRHIQDLARERGVDFYSAYEGIARALHNGEPVYWENDFHFTPVGQRIWAGLIADFYVPRLLARRELRALPASQNGPRKIQPSSKIDTR